MQNGQTREEERDGKTKGQRVWNKNKGNGREQDNNKQCTVHRSIYARRWQQRTGSLNMANRRKDTAAFSMRPRVYLMRWKKEYMWYSDNRREETKDPNHRKHDNTSYDTGRKNLIIRRTTQGKSNNWLGIQAPLNTIFIGQSLWLYATLAHPSERIANNIRWK